MARVNDRRALSLLDLAVAATLAIVPVMVGVLLLVASARQPEHGNTAVGGDRHVSVRHVAALRRQDRADVGPQAADIDVQCRQRSLPGEKRSCSA